MQNKWQCGPGLRALKIIKIKTLTENDEECPKRPWLKSPPVLFQTSISTSFSLEVQRSVQIGWNSPQCGNPAQGLIQAMYRACVDWKRVRSAWWATRQGCLHTPCVPWEGFPCQAYKGWQKRSCWNALRESREPGYMDIVIPASHHATVTDELWLL